MSADQPRLESLVSAAAKADPKGFVAIQVSDLRWLLDTVTRSNRDGQPGQPDHDDEGPQTGLVQDATQTESRNDREPE